MPIAADQIRRCARPRRMRRPRAPCRRMRATRTGGGSSVFYIIIFAGLAVLLVVAVLVQRSRNK